MVHMPSKVAFDELVSLCSLIIATAALERADGVTADDVEEIFFGNVLAAK